MRNLSPDSEMLQEVSEWPLPPGIPIHSIIGNEDEAGVPGAENARQSRDLAEEAGVV